MTNTCHDWRSTSVDRSYNGFLIKSPKIFKRSAAPREHDNIEFRYFFNQLEGGDNFRYLMASGDLKAAQTAYEKALANAPSNSQAAQLIAAKLNMTRRDDPSG